MYAAFLLNENMREFGKTTKFLKISINGKTQSLIQSRFIPKVREEMKTWFFYFLTMMKDISLQKWWFGVKGLRVESYL